jgi:hypothetical protein
MAPFVYRQAQPFLTLWLAMPLAALGTGLGLAFSDDPNAPAGIVIAMGVYALVLVLLGRLVIELRGPRLHWSLGFVGWPHWQVALADIASLERTQLPTLKLRCTVGAVGRLGLHVARSGIAANGHARAGIPLVAALRGRSGNRVFNASIGGPALKLTLHDGRSITLGTPEPERLAAFLSARMPPTR